MSVLSNMHQTTQFVSCNFHIKRPKLTKQWCNESAHPSSAWLYAAHVLVSVKLSYPSRSDILCYDIYMAGGYDQMLPICRMNFRIPMAAVARSRSVARCGPLPLGWLVEYVSKESTSRDHQMRNERIFELGALPQHDHDSNSYPK